MLSSSLRRAAWTPMPLPGITRSGQNVTSSLLGATRPLHQRRYSSSSSKPPVPPSDGPRRLDTTPAKGVNSSSEKSKATRRRGKDSATRHASSKSSQQHAAFSNLPSVPSTQHRQPHGKCLVCIYPQFRFFPAKNYPKLTFLCSSPDVHVASFFSIHRPISVTTTVPPTSSTDAFEAIFSSKRPLKNEPEDVIFTLSSAVQNMENGPQGMAESEEQFRTFSEQDGELRMLDGPEAKMSVEEYTRRLRPFQPPPPPVPMDASAIEAAQSQNAHVDNEFQTFSTVLTIREARGADGRKTYEAHTGPFVRSEEMDDPSSVHDEISIEAPADSTGATYMERLRNNRTMHALSTKRRRQAKMKKHKFKKLMKRTRTLRRKLDKT
ncbi:uncharacterized protein N7506_010686 [Penicillium brevicompactum]|uniref:Small ribosomal subunit protein mS38 n=1 Tax=Penicillium brevicompactum TaxID=5074 RepID=A0A9W9UE40_PENBR|nr:uncharacterized protein N7506_010686 [Penicillium brevicompactum]KAJ5327584.1 hypothetical protein N7506_010686 [Penicillium brevicompactum]KAJ5337612.1 hypothetical protein N7452_004340 [Penicillium brevicompactum]